MIDLPKYLYYYSDITADKRRDWVSEILIDHKVYFRPRSVLNDPAELRPTLRYDAPRKELREFAKKFFEDYATKKLPPATRLIFRKQMEERFLRNPESSELVLHGLLDKVGILSLSSISDEPLLWSYYANGHRGIAIEFDTSAGLFNTAMEVKYPLQLPIINRIRDTEAEIFEKALATKTSKWEHEKEWRIVARWTDEKRNNIYNACHPHLARFMKTQHGPGHYEIPKESINRIIVGCNVSNSDKAWLDGVLAQSKSTVRVSKASQNRDGSLRIEF